MGWMNTPNLSCKIEMFCTINPSESIEKVEQTIWLDLKQKNKLQKKLEKHGFFFN